MIEPAAGNVSSPWKLLQAFPVADLVFDRALQCRVSVNEDVVTEYAELMEAGVGFPAIRVVRVDGQAYLVDGWHRALAAQRARKDSIAAELREGTRREALLEAVGANRAHGLQRSREDKRRAVGALLQDVESCALSSRELGDLAGVSHTMVNQVRAHYGIERGEPLTEARIEELDGTLPAAWQNLASKYSYMGPETVRKFRTATTLAKVAAARRDTYHLLTKDLDRQAVSLRLCEIATAEWPWPEDDTEKARSRRAAKLDTTGDLEAALLARDCPNVVQLFDAWRLSRMISKLDTWRVKEALEACKGRKALEAALRDRGGDAKRESDAPMPWQVADTILAGFAEKGLPETIAPDVFASLESRLRTRNASNDLILAVRERAVGVERCSDPRCLGWIRPRQWQQPACILCVRSAGDYKAARDDAVDLVASLLAGEHLQLRLGDAVVTRDGVAMLGELASCAQLSRKALDAWIEDAPALLKGRLHAYLDGLAALPEPARAPEPEEDLEAMIEEIEDLLGELLAEDDDAQTVLEEGSALLPLLGGPGGRQYRAADVLPHLDALPAAEARAYLQHLRKVSRG